MKITLRICMACVALSSIIAADAYTIDDYTSAMNQRRYSEAVSVMNEVIKNEASPTADLYYKRAVAYEKKGEYVFAVVDAASALTLGPVNQEYSLLSARCKKKLNDPTYVQDAQNAGKEGEKLLESSYLAQVQATQPAPQSIAVIPGTSDVDRNVPKTSAKNENTFVLIFGIENYSEKNISKAVYAVNDGNTFREYCLKTLGIPEQNIHSRFDATRNQIRSEINWARNLSDAYGRDANLIVYYSGHGMPDESTRRAYLLPSDGIANDPESGYSLNKLYQELGEMNFNSSLVLLDACFSGMTRSGQMLTNTKGVGIRPSDEELSGNVAVFAATLGDDNAYPDEKNAHGLFTYFLLKKLQETRGDVTINDMADYVTTQVKRISVVRNTKSQMPVINYSPESTVNLSTINLLKR